ncbi:GNAT family N-acetyltransferase [Micrococcus luteus]|uniref:GNAT family N-acetyltransferase n=1 Tax=Micrococcus luteus TaxID=1270 RepID=UPI0010AE39BB|nr:GNAT family protein [Micrococcus luteus]MCV7532560.1 GNAT family N-acetyltransferase [Micrococcus luteus]TKD53433.1 GNAT family N-acetyltransferase [Micrococcus luteus]
MPVRLRPAVLDDAKALAALARSQREHLAPWEPERPAHWFPEVGQREALEQTEHDRAADRSYAFVITDDARHLFGRLTLASVVRGAGQFCSLGYWVAREATGRGVAGSAVGQALQIAFDELGLHRVQAEILPHNHASRRVLECHRFQRYGLAPQYLRIAGRWQDHELWQLLAPTEGQR